MQRETTALPKKTKSDQGRPDDGDDADGDGKIDLGMLPPGTYQYYTVPSVPKNAVLGLVFKPVHNAKSPLGIRVLRDSNRDGNFTEADEVMIKN